MVTNIIKISNNFHIFKSFFNFYDDCSLSFKIFYDNFILMIFNLSVQQDMSNNHLYYYVLKYNDSYITDDIYTYLLNVLNDNLIYFNNRNDSQIYNHLSKHSIRVYNWFSKHYQIKFNKNMFKLCLINSNYNLLYDYYKQYNSFDDLKDSDYYLFIYSFLNKTNVDDIICSVNSLIKSFPELLSKTDIFFPFLFYYITIQFPVINQKNIKLVFLMKKLINNDNIIWFHKSNRILFNDDDSFLIPIYNLSFISNITSFIVDYMINDYTGKIPYFIKKLSKYTINKNNNDLNTYLSSFFINFNKNINDILTFDMKTNQLIIDYSSSSE